MNSSHLFSVVAIFNFCIACSPGFSTYDVQQNSNELSEAQRPQDLPVNFKVCVSPPQRGSSRTDVNRLTGRELKNSLEDILGGKILSEVRISLDAIPDDTAFTDLKDFGTEHTGELVNQILQLAFSLSEIVIDRPEYRAQIVGACAQDLTKMDSPCWDSFLKSFGQRAYRRPLTVDEIQTLKSSMTSDNSESLKTTIARILSSPYFLYHIEDGVRDTATASRIRLSDYEVAARISFGATQSPPDAELFKAAESGQLRSLDGVKLQATRLLCSPRGRSKIFEFFRYWLSMNNFDDPDISTAKNLGVDPVTLKAQAREEMQAFFQYIICETDGTVADLMKSKKVFPKTNNLSLIYGTPLWDGKSSPPEATHHSGILGRAGFLISGSDTTNIIRRGVTIRKRILCLPQPSPDFQIVDSRVQAFEDISPILYSNRQRVASLTGAPTCIGCHASINPTGYVLENFGPLGEWRTTEKVYDAKDPKKILAFHQIDTRVDDLKLERSIANSAQGFDDFVQSISESTSLRECLARYNFEITQLRAPVESDSCGLVETLSVLKSTGSIKDAFIQAIANEDIFWRKSQ